MRRIVLHFLTLLTCNADLLPEEARASSSRTNALSSAPSQPRLWRRMTARSFSVDPNAPDAVFTIIYISILFDALDLVNAVVDIVLVSRLFAEADAIYYAILLLVRIAIERAIPVTML